MERLEDILRRIMFHRGAAGDPVRTEDGTERCATCLGRGVELYWFGGGRYIRPCPHCEDGRRTLTIWLTPPKDKSAPSIWSHLSPEDIGRIYSRADPVPAWAAGAGTRPAAAQLAIDGANPEEGAHA